MQSTTQALLTAIFVCVPDEADFQPTCDSYLLDAQLLDLHFCRDGSICIDISDEEETDVAPEDAGIHGSRKVGLAIQKLQLALSEGRPTVGAGMSKPWRL